LDDGLFAAGQAVQPRPSALQDKIIFIAPTFEESVPMPEEAFAAWTAINQILRNDSLLIQPVWIQGFFMVVISLLTLLVLTLVPVAKTRWAVIGAQLVFFSFVTWCFFLKGWLLPMAIPMLWYFLIFAFEFYVNPTPIVVPLPPVVIPTPVAPVISVAPLEAAPPVAAVAAAPITGLRLRKPSTEIPSAVLRGVQADAMILASEWSGLTDFTQSIEPMAVANLLRQFQSRLHDKIQSAPGASELLDGKRLLVSWGALDRSDQHPLVACRTAWAQFEILDVLRPTTPLLREPTIRLGSALHRGMVTAGQLGPESRVGILGSGVDFAWHLQSLNLIYGTSILLTDSFFSEVQEAIRVRVVDRLMIHGKLETLYEMIGLISPRSETPSWVVPYHEALSLYWEREWDRAIAGFEVIQKLRPEGDSVSRLMIQRANYFSKNPPSETWQGEPPTGPIG
jgi:class 3 adenylate cyclase